MARRILESAWWAGFTFNGITAYGVGERDALLELCRQRLDAFREQCGEEVFAHRRGRFVLIAGERRPGAAGKALGLRRRRI